MEIKKKTIFPIHSSSPFNRIFSNQLKNTPKPTNTTHVHYVFHFIFALNN